MQCYMIWPLQFVIILTGARLCEAVIDHVFTRFKSIIDELHAKALMSAAHLIS